PSTALLAGKFAFSREDPTVGWPCETSTGSSAAWAGTTDPTSPTTAVRTAIVRVRTTLSTRRSLTGSPYRGLRAVTDVGQEPAAQPAVVAGGDPPLGRRRLTQHDDHPGKARGGEPGREHVLLRGGRRLRQHQHTAVSGLQRGDDLLD